MTKPPNLLPSAMVGIKINVSVKCQTSALVSPQSIFTSLTFYLFQKLLQFPTISCPIEAWDFLSADSQDEGNKFHLYVELDFKEVTSKKTAIIENSPELRGKVGEAALISQDKGEVIGDHYKLLHVDLRDMQQLDHIISLADMDPRFNFLDKSTGLSTPFEIRNGSVVDAVSRIVETHSPLHVAGVEGLVILGKSRGQVLRMLDEHYALVRWEHTKSGVLVSLLRLAKELHLQNPEEVIVNI